MIELHRIRARESAEPGAAPAVAESAFNRQLRHFPISSGSQHPARRQRRIPGLSVIAGDRPGLLSRIARVLTAYDINLQTAKVNTLGARAEDVFLVTGAALRDAKTVVKFEAELVDQLRT